MKVLLFCCKGFENFGFYEEAYDKRFLNLIAEFDRQKKYIANFCPETAVDVAFTLLNDLVGKKNADAVIFAMGYKLKTTE